MPKIKNWTTVHTRDLDDEAVTERVAEVGHGEIARFEHDPTGCEVVYIYHPEAEQPFLLKCVTDGVAFKQEGRYETRTEGYENGNRPLRHQNSEIPELETTDS